MTEQQSTEQNKHQTSEEKAKSFQVLLDQKKCVANGVCQRIDPNNFFIKENTAELVKGHQENQNSVRSLVCTPQEAQKLIAAAEACPVNAIQVINKEDNTKVVKTEVDTTALRVIHAQYDDRKEFMMDQKGYFLIKVDHQKKEIHVGFCPTVNKVSVKIIGTKPLEIYQTAIKENLLSRYDHAAYLGRELQKAYIALQKKIAYIQDDELDFSPAY